MKTNIEKSNDLRHTITGENFNIKIRLNDECKNGHQDFSITATFWEQGKPHTDRFMTRSGCCHKEILKVRPDLKPFIDLHLSTAKGVPMYAIENGFYFLKEGNNGKSAKQATTEYLRLKDGEFEILEQAEDKVYFQAMIEKLGIHERWQNEAAEAIRILEGMTGKEFVNDSKKEGFTPLGEKLKEVERMIESGYYSPEKISDRNNQKELEKKNALIKSLTEERDKKILKANIEFNIQIEVLRCGLSLDNFIYYNHTNEACFNWNTNSYNKAVTLDQFNDFLKIVDYSTLPEGIKFKNSK